MPKTIALVAGSAAALALSLGACGDDDEKTKSDTSSTTPADTSATTEEDTAATTTTEDTTTTDTTPATLCAKYGGPTAIAGLIKDQLVPALADDCRINSFFTTLTPAALTHVSDCLTNQVQEVMSCPGVVYAGSMDAAGVACRDMVTAHAGLKISTGDFDALVEDLIGVLTAAGVQGTDIAALSPVVTALRDPIIEQDDVQDPTKSGCPTRTLCQKYGGSGVIDSVIQEGVIGAIADDCRINAFFTALTPAALTHVSECLSIQAQELFSCKGVVYAGSTDTAGVACRTMADAHEGLGISKGDFDALVEDLVTALTQAGVAGTDIAAASPAITALRPEIIEDNENADPTQSQCVEPQ